jgi:DNA mismatch repair protein MutS
MAGMPNTVIENANTLLHQLEESHNIQGLGKKMEDRELKMEKKGKGQKTNPSSILHPPSSIFHPPSSLPVRQAGGYQLSFIQLEDPTLLQIKEDILNTDINTLTPVEALMKLNEIKKLLGK